MIPLIQMMA